MFDYPKLLGKSFRSNFFNWKFVRVIGQLQLLNLISISILIFVPILAAFWPMVQRSVNSYNAAVMECEKTLVQLKKDLEVRVSGASNGSNEHSASQNELDTRSSKGLQNLSPSFASLLDELLAKISRGIIEVNYLPNSWAFAFFASLFVLIARTVFQLTCPEVIRDMSLGRYIETRKDDFAKTPSDWNLSQAIASLEGSGLMMDSVQAEKEALAKQTSEILSLQVDLKKLDIRLHQLRCQVSTNDIDSQMRALRNDRQEIAQLLQLVREGDKGQHGPQFRLRMSIIEAAAKLEYERSAMTRVIGLAISFSSYCLGIMFLLFILYNQVINVASAAGWW